MLVPFPLGCRLVRWGRPGRVAGLITGEDVEDSRRVGNSAGEHTVDVIGRDLFGEVTLQRVH